MQIRGTNTIFKAIDVALDRRKLSLAFGGIVAIVLGAGLFVYLASVVGADEAAVGVIFMGLGGIIAWVLASLFSGALTYMSWQELTTDRRPTASEAMAFSSQHIVSYMLSPLALLLTGVVLVAVEALLLLLGRVPYLGELFVSVLFLPLVVLNILVTIGILAGNWLVFPIVTESGANVPQTVQRVVDIVRKAPGRLVMYFVLAQIVILLTLLLLWPLVALGHVETVALMEAGVGAEKMGQIASSNALGALATPQTLIASPEALLERVLGGVFGFYDPPFTIKVAGFLMGLEVIALFTGALYIFPWVFGLTLSCAIYLNLGDTAGAPASSPAGMPRGASPAGGRTMAMPGSGAAPPPSPSPSPSPTPGSYSPPQRAAPPQRPANPPSPRRQPPAKPSCTNCGREIKTSSRFCPFCGTQQT